MSCKIITSSKTVNYPLTSYAYESRTELEAHCEAHRIPCGLEDDLCPIGKIEAATEKALAAIEAAQRGHKKWTVREAGPEAHCSDCKASMIYLYETPVGLMCNVCLERAANK